MDGEGAAPRATEEPTVFITRRRRPYSHKTARRTGVEGGRRVLRGVAGEYIANCFFFTAAAITHTRVTVYTYRPVRLIVHTTT